MKTTYALLVGINTYPPPIPELGGCIKDLDQIEGFLRGVAGQGVETVDTINGLPLRQFGSLRICRLENQQATYNNIIKGFRQFLRQAGADDAVWFHFSGHGSEEFTAEEFLEIEPNGKDQTLVCYQAGPDEGGQLHLADKELAVLLHEVATQDTSGEPKASPHIVVSLDCCHSGSGTRDIEEELTIKSRNYNALRATTRGQAARVRSLDSYIDGFYAGQWKAMKGFEVPVAPHVLLSACESVQKASDLPAGGLFTSGLIEALKSAQGNINYADLFVRSRSTVQRIVKKFGREQMPQFETIGSFNPYTRFLDGSSLGTPNRYEIRHENGQWMVKCGAIHGIPIKPPAPVEVEVRTAAPESRPLGTAVLEGIGAQKSRLKLNDGLALSPEQDYQATLRFLPAPPAFVLLRGETSAIETLKEVWDPSKNIQWIASEQLEDTGEPPLEVEATNGKYLIHDRKNGRLALEVVQSTDTSRMVIDALGKIVNWERTLQLRNDKSAIQQWISLDLGVMGKNHQVTFHSGAELVLSATTDSFMEKSGALFAGFTPRARIKGAEQNLHCYLFHLRSNYGIESYEGEVVFRPDEHPGKAEVLLPLWKSAKGWGLSPGEQEAVSHFMLLACTESLDYHQLLQGGLGPTRDMLFDWNPLAVSDDWCSQVIKVRLVRRDS
ncbi:MAG: caspase family protein [Lewinellaceae bacterium]|nr:caspase family protein [Lewinellaceae bacterium]